MQIMSAEVKWWVWSWGKGRDIYSNMFSYFVLIKKKALKKKIHFLNLFKTQMAQMASAVLVVTFQQPHCKGLPGRLACVLAGLKLRLVPELCP